MELRVAPPAAMVGRQLQALACVVGFCGLSLSRVVMTSSHVYLLGINFTSAKILFYETNFTK